MKHAESSSFFLAIILSILLHIIVLILIFMSMHQVYSHVYAHQDLANTTLATKKKVAFYTIDSLSNTNMTDAKTSKINTFPPTHKMVILQPSQIKPTLATLPPTPDHHTETRHDIKPNVAPPPKPAFSLAQLSNGFCNYMKHHKPSDQSQVKPNCRLFTKPEQAVLLKHYFEKLGTYIKNIFYLQTRMFRTGIINMVLEVDQKGNFNHLQIIHSTIDQKKLKNVIEHCYNYRSSFPALPHSLSDYRRFLITLVIKSHLIYDFIALSPDKS